MRIVSALPVVTGQVVAGWWPLLAVGSAVIGVLCGRKVREVLHGVDPVRIRATPETVPATGQVTHRLDLLSSHPAGHVRVVEPDQWQRWESEFPYDAHPQVPTQREPGDQS